MALYVNIFPYDVVWEIFKGSKKKGVKFKTSNKKTVNKTVKLLRGKILRKCI